MPIVSLLECVFCTANVGFGVCLCGDGSFVNHCACVAFAWDWASVFVPTFALFTCLFLSVCLCTFAQYLCVVGFDKCFHVGGTAIA